jgi:hypothetical protein
MLLLKIKYNENKENIAIRMKQYIQKNKKKNNTHILSQERIIKSPHEWDI